MTDREKMIEAIAKAISQTVGEYVMPGGDLRLAAAAVLDLLEVKALVEAFDDALALLLLHTGADDDIANLVINKGRAALAPFTEAKT